MLLLASQAQADQLADIKAAGFVKSPPSTPTRRSALWTPNPPYRRLRRRLCRALAKALGVKLELVATNPANRIPLLQSGKADLIVADTITRSGPRLLISQRRISSPASSSSCRPALRISSMSTAKRASAR